MSAVEIQNLKLRISNSNIKAVLLFGAETWMVTKPITDRVQVFVNRFLRSILGIRWPLVIWNEDLWEITNKERVANHSRPQSLRSFWLAAGIESSGSNHFRHAP